MGSQSVCMCWGGGEGRRGRCVRGVNLQVQGSGGLRLMLMSCWTTLTWNDCTGGMGQTASHCEIMRVALGRSAAGGEKLHVLH